jgi:peptidoglycan-N-acetylmuramic acid deacetylase
MLLRNSCLLLACLFCLSIFGGCQRNERNKSVSDFGGIYAVDAKIMDFRVEVSGRLTGREADVKPDESADQLASTYSDDVYSNKLLRWGISRKAGNVVPNADPGAPQLLKKNGGIYIGDTSKKEIYLTFDEGYENGYTDKILDVLKENNVKAVFFITGPYLKDHLDIVRRMVEEGHEVGNHADT